jgi:FMN phosphatase YigB (HAD superfamily)
MPISAVLFDLDNTLIDFLKLKRMCVENAVDAMIDSGLDIPKEDAIKILFEIYMDLGDGVPAHIPGFFQQSPRPRRL